MRVREWYSWHFPELVRIVPDNYTYARLALAIQEKGSLSDDRKEELAEILRVAFPAKNFRGVPTRRADCPTTARWHSAGRLGSGHGA
jgi:RNA processing factor Prp31